MTIDNAEINIQQLKVCGCVRNLLARNPKGITAADHVIILNCTVKRIKRKSAKRNQDFASYLANLKTTHKLVVKNNHPSSSSSSEGSDQVSQHLLLPPKIDDEDFVKNVQRKWQQHKANCYLVEVLTGLQASLQRVCENLVLLDRVEYLREKGIESCRLEMVTDDRISPRCFALVAVKSQSS